VLADVRHRLLREAEQAQMAELRAALAAHMRAAGRAGPTRACAMREDSSRRSALDLLRVDGLRIDDLLAAAAVLALAAVPRRVRDRVVVEARYALRRRPRGRHPRAAPRRGRAPAGRHRLRQRRRA
jgi:hypothetical protein